MIRRCYDRQWSVNSIRLIILLFTAIICVLKQYQFQFHDIVNVPSFEKQQHEIDDNNDDNASILPHSARTKNSTDITISMMSLNVNTTTTKSTTATLPIAVQASIPTSVPVSTPAPTTTAMMYPIVIYYNHWSDLERFMNGIWDRNYFCNTIRDTVQEYYANNTSTQTLAIPTIHMTFELSCAALFEESGYGTGNYLHLIYMMRLSVRYIPDANIKLNITCSDDKAKNVRSNYIIPWVTGVWYSPHYFHNVPAASYEHETNRKDQLIWLQGQQSKLDSEGSIQQHAEQSNPKPVLSRNLYCGSFSDQPTALMSIEMRYDIRRMVIALIGSTNLPPEFPHRTKIANFLLNHVYTNSNSVVMSDSNTTSLSKRDVHILPGNQQERMDVSTTNIVPLLDESILPTNDFDDVIIHFRCGDLLSTDLPTYGFLTFDGYSRHIDRSTAKKIGIVTQPFGDKNTDNQERERDTSNADRCRILVYAFVDYLHEQFPKTTVTIRNSRSDSITVTYIRMVLAQQVIGSMSTFSVYPIVGTFGKGYFLSPQPYEPTMWLVQKQYPITKIIDTNDENNVVLFHEKVKLVGNQTKDLWDEHGEEAVIHWFRTGEKIVQ